MSAEFRFADAAGPALAVGGAVEVPQRHLSPIVEARLAEVVHRLRSDWLFGCARKWGDVCAIREVAGSDLDKHVATTLARGFFQFSQFLAGFEVLVLELKHSGVVSEQCLLSLEQLIVESRNPFRDQVEVPDPEQRLADVLGGAEG